MGETTPPASAVATGKRSRRYKAWFRFSHQNEASMSVKPRKPPPAAATADENTRFEKTRREVSELIDAVPIAKRGGQEGNKNASKNERNNIPFVSKRGTSESHLRRKLREKRPDLLREGSERG